MSTTILILLLLAAAGFAVFLWVRVPALVAGRRGRILLLVALLIVPLALVQLGVSRSLSGSKQIDFCTSCHEMEVYDTSLRIDDPEYVPANHFQNNYVRPEAACYTCHTDYTLYGDVEAKLNGLRHVAVHYFGDIPAPGEIELYKPYPNDNCLQCHQGARRFEKKPAHNRDGVTIAALYANEKSCVSGGCHDKIHDIAHLAQRDLWGEPRFPIPEVLRRAPAGDAEDPFAEDGAEDPFAEDGGAKDPFADEPEAPAGDAPAQAIDDVDALWDDEKPADAPPATAPGDGDARQGDDAPATAPQEDAR